MTGLIKFNEAYQALMVAKNIDEVKEIRDKMEALRAYLKQQGESLEMQNACAEIKLRAERRAGELLLEVERGNGTRTDITSIRPETRLQQVMRDNDLSRPAVYRFQSIANVPELVFESHIAQTKAAQNELTSAGMQKLARDIKAKETYQQRRDEPAPVCTSHILADIRHVTLEQLGGVPFNAIILDPAWEFEAWDQKTGDGKSPEYDLMTIEDIYNIPVSSLAALDSVVFLWSTNPFLPQALRAMETWGFSYRSKFPWIKTTLKNQMLDYGTGYWVRGVSEDVLIGVKGNVTAPRVENFLGLIGPNIEHSRKPQDVHTMAEATTAGPYLELFARYSRPGWITVGNEYRGERPADPTPSPVPPWLKR